MQAERRVPLPAQPRTPWRSAPELDELEGAGAVLGTCEQVLATLRLQAFLRRWLHARDSVPSLLCERIVRELVRAALEGRGGHGSDPYSSRPIEPPGGLHQCFKNLDTGVSIPLSEMESMYADAPLSAFELAIRASRLHRQGPPWLENLRDSTDVSVLSSHASFHSPIALPHRSGSEPHTGPRRRRRGVNEFATEPLMSGPLLKRGRKMGHWKLRWYSVSVEGELTCHRHRGDVDRKEPLFSAWLDQVRVSVLPPERHEQALTSSGVFGFLLEWEEGVQRGSRLNLTSTPNASGSRELFAETQSTFDQWMRAFALLGAAAGLQSVGVPQRLQERGQGRPLLLTRGEFERPGSGQRGAWGSSDLSGSRDHLAAEASDTTILDSWGFQLKGADAEVYYKYCQMRYESKEVKRLAKQHERWMKVLRIIEGANSVPHGIPGVGGPRAAYELVLAGVPSSLRVRVWIQLSGVAETIRCFPQHYSEMLMEGMAMCDADRAEIEQDLHRTFPNHPLFSGVDLLSSLAPQTPPGASTHVAEGDDGFSESVKREPAGRTALRRLLLAYAAHKQSMGYCQAINYLAAMLLLATELQEEPAFWLLIHLTEHSVPDFYSKKMTGIRVVQNLFASFLRAALPKLHAHLEQDGPSRAPRSPRAAKVGLPISIFTTQWFMCLFVEAFPAETLLRVWDLLIPYGPEVLFRVGAALLKMRESELLATSDFIALSTKLQGLGHNVYEVDELLNVAHRNLLHNNACRRALTAVQKVHDTSLAVTPSLDSVILELQARAQSAAANRELPRLSLIGRRKTEFGGGAADLSRKSVGPAESFRQGALNQSWRRGLNAELVVEGSEVEGSEVEGSEGGWENQPHGSTPSNLRSAMSEERETRESEGDDNSSICSEDASESSPDAGQMHECNTRTSIGFGRSSSPDSIILGRERNQSIEEIDLTSTSSSESLTPRSALAIEGHNAVNGGRITAEVSSVDEWMPSKDDLSDLPAETEDLADAPVRMRETDAPENHLRAKDGQTLESDVIYVSDAGTRETQL